MLETKRFRKTIRNPPILAEISISGFSDSPSKLFSTIWVLIAVPSVPEMI